MTANSEVIFVVEKSPEGGFEAYALDHGIYTEADSVAKLKTLIRDAVGVHFEDADRPAEIRLHFVREEMLAV